MTQNFSENNPTTASKKLQTNFGAGPDGVPAVLLMKVGENLCKPLSIMWRESLKTGVIPSPLKVGSTCPIYKGGDGTKLKNYRVVTLTSHVNKFFEKNNSEISSKLLGKQQFV